MKLLIVDDHALFREGLGLLLSRLADEVQVLGAETVRAGIAVAGNERLDLILLDLLLPGLHGLDGIDAFRKQCPDSPIVLLSAVYDQKTVREGLSRGAQGFVPKTLNAEDTLSALRAVLQGEIWIPNDSDATAVAMPATVISPDNGISLTRRQMDVLSQLCEGHSNKEIGKALDMSDNTVRSHVAAIFRALEAKSRTEAALLARRRGLV